MGEVGAAPPTERSAWVDAARGFSVVAVVSFHTWIWVFVPLAEDYWPPAYRIWDLVNSHLGSVRMPLLLLLSGMLAGRALLSGLGEVRVWVRAFSNYYLYVVWLAVFGLISWALPAGDLPHRVTSVNDALTQVLAPDTPLWYIFALAVYTLSLAALSRVPPWAVLTGLAVVGVAASAVELPGYWDRILSLAVFFAMGVHGRKQIWVFEERTSWAWFVIALVPAELLTLFSAKTSSPLLGASADLLRFALFGLAALAAVAVLVRIPRVAEAGSFVGRRTLQVYVGHVPLLWALLSLAATAEFIGTLGSSPAFALLAPLCVAGAVTAAAVALRPLLSRIGAGWLVEPPARVGQLAGRLPWVQPANSR